ncbi:hypothetical protein ACET3X_000639 [Alternaria dauci]|uniref:Uncharacterized protein n=1 Tax=Alternaria dauci TaxID=48095 RepID=A0ABR3UVI2_9PLEO
MSVLKKTPTSGGVDFPYSWETTFPELGLVSIRELPKLILCADFLEPWAMFRDQMPLRPGTAVPIIAPKDKEAMKESVVKIYDLMDSMSYCRYDQPNRDERESWGVKEWLECLIYKSARNLARDGHTFAVLFQRVNLKNEPGRREAFRRICGLIMLMSNLCVNYTLMAPSNVIKKMEAARPAKDPNPSPIPEVRVKWQLSNVTVDELRKKVLDCERKGKEEKEWLISILMGKEVALIEANVGASTGSLPETLVKEDNVRVLSAQQHVDIAVGHESMDAKKESSVKVVGTKRAKPGSEEEEQMMKAKLGA